MALEEAQELAREVPRWRLTEKLIERDFAFKDFREAVDFVNNVADIADAQGHHPDITISYNKVRLTLTTHKIRGLSRNDFIVAAMIDHSVEGAVGVEYRTGKP